MTNYRVYLRSDLQWAMRHFEAKTPKQAIKAARRFADKHLDDLDFENFEACDCPINEVEICDEDEQQLAVWRDEDLSLRLAAQDLLDALEQAVAALNAAPRFRVPGLDKDSYQIASICDRAIAKAKEGAA